MKLIYKQTENYNFRSQYYSCVKIFWSVEGNQIFIDTKNRLNSQNKTISNSIFDIIDVSRT